ncbi:MAG: GHKL domain-containing protein [Holophagae bacterium]|nr:GHKL domain-containing protein [Holophagae bacterium]
MKIPEDFGAVWVCLQNVLIVDEHNHIVHSGDNMQDILCASDPFIKENLLDSFPEPEVRSAIEEALKSARSDNERHLLKIPGIDTALMVFATGKHENQIVIAVDTQMETASHMKHEVQVRVKELECLYGISREMKGSRDLDVAINNSIQHVIEGFQYSEIASVKIELNPGKVYGDRKMDPTTAPNTLRKPILVGDEEIGRIFVFYREPADFLDEEDALLTEISIILANRLERLKYVRTLEKRRKVLLAKNEKLVELTENCSAARKKLQAVLNAITDKVAVIGPDYSVILSNTEDIHAGGTCHKEIFSCDDRCENCPSEIAFSESRAAMTELRKGEKHYVVRAYPILNDEGKVERVVETCSDVTKQKQMEEQLFQSYKLASIGKLVAGIAHEINNPNTFIRGNVKIIREAFQDIFPWLDKISREHPDLKLARLNYDMFREHIPQLIEDMDHGTDRINKIVLGLRNFAKKDDGLLTEDVDLNSLIRNDLRIVKKEIEKNARIQENLDEKLPEFKGNRQKMEQVLMNLLTNAAQAIEADNGLIIIETSFENTEENVVLLIRDNGTGMDEKTRKHIFDPFFTTKRDKGGTGLGLSILYGIIKEHGGKIDINSRIGEGTTFTIRIPLRKGDKL